MFDELAHLAEALSILGHVTPRSLDAIAAFGEQLHRSSVTAYFKQRGIPAEYVDARDVMITDDRLSWKPSRRPPKSPSARARLFCRWCREGKFL